MSRGLFPEELHTMRGVTCANMTPIEDHAFLAENAFEGGQFLRALLLCEALVHADEFSAMTYYLQAQTFLFLARAAHHLNLEGFGLDDAKRALKLFQQFQTTVVDPITDAGAQNVVDAFYHGELRQRIFEATVISGHAIARAEESIAGGQVGDSCLTVAGLVGFLKSQHSNGCSRAQRLTLGWTRLCVCSSNDYGILDTHRG